MYIHKIREFILKQIPIIQSPTTEAFGNCAEEIYFCLLRAHRENRKTILLFPDDLGKMFVFSKTGRGFNKVLASVRTEQRVLDNNNWVIRILTTLLVIKGCWIILLNIALLRFRLGKLKRATLQPTIGRSRLWVPLQSRSGKSGFEDWSQHLKQDLRVTLEDKYIEEGQRRRLCMGLPANAWYACVHVREGGYYGWDKEGPGKRIRNASIENYLEAMQCIVDRGGWIVRLGDSTMQALPQLTNVIDYPMTEYKSNLMDVFLIMECRFFLGELSGPWDVANLFSRPTLMPNLTDFYVGYPWRRGSMGIVKKVYSKSGKRFLSINEILDFSLDNPNQLTLDQDFEYIENSSAEILSLVNEYFDEKGHTRPLTELQEAVINRRMNHVDNVLAHPTWSATHKNRLISRLIGCRGKISQGYLSKYWN